ncbi:hypothetical protein TSOC_009899 [Tetrabaena socialis]|uniref:Uncharacterized protein n=1 Tax=Tetrabaena socialis TaxID=47790 RepID=A0A2J7ZUP7_9CHLO|nr:hypothetical protein TSOC_009899 [Tetrabaena socialis]|eukprot:PNH03994.1 hypothetical protein TSOC_009899 [Tetrabaena socialis]
MPAEIEAYEQALHSALGELQRVRASEEARLAVRVDESTRRFSQQLEMLQQQYLAEVEKLKRQTVEELHKQRALCEATLASRMRVLQGELRHERPAGMLPPPHMALPRSPRAAGTTQLGAAAAGLRAPPSPSPLSLRQDIPGRPTPGVRMRSAPNSRWPPDTPGGNTPKATPAGAGYW